MRSTIGGDDVGSGGGGGSAPRGAAVDINTGAATPARNTL